MNVQEEYLPTRVWAIIYKLLKIIIFFYLLALDAMAVARMVDKKRLSSPNMTAFRSSQMRSGEGK